MIRRSAVCFNRPLMDAGSLAGQASRTLSQTGRSPHITYILPLSPITSKCTTSDGWFPDGWGAGPNMTPPPSPQSDAHRSCAWRHSPQFQGWQARCLRKRLASGYFYGRTPSISLSRLRIVSLKNMTALQRRREVARAWLQVHPWCHSQRTPVR